VVSIESTAAKSGSAQISRVTALFGDLQAVLARSDAVLCCVVTVVAGCEAVQISSVVAALLVNLQAA
jgi:hypothetical protein